jgi:hypothetical protein
MRESIKSILKLTVAMVLGAGCASLLSGQSSALMAKNEAPNPPSVGMEKSATTTDATGSVAGDANGEGGIGWPGRGHNAVPKVVTTLEVTANNALEVQAVESTAVISQKEMQSAAGTFGDFTRYLQVMPGVVWNSDLSNEILVRGGHPMENLFVVDGIEIANINHFALSGSNGGFTSMLDTAVIGNVEMKADAWDAAYSSRLSSLIEIHTRELEPGQKAGEASFGIAGAGGFYQSPLPGRFAEKGSVLFSAHRSMINLLTNDIGINGVPTYTNGLLKVAYAPTANDRFTVLSLGGNDSINITPCPSDARATSVIQTEYAGWRSTEAFSWDHQFSTRTTSKLTASESTMSQKIGQQQQDGYLNTANNEKTCNAASLTSVYGQNSVDGMSNLSYTVRMERKGWLISTGASEQLTAPKDTVTQPVGQLSPFSASTTLTDAANFNKNFTTGESAGFVEAEGSLGKRWKMLAGVRGEYFELDHSFGFDPRVSIAYQLNNHQVLHASAGMASQLAPLMDMISFKQNQSLKPITVQQESVGMRVWQGSWGTLDADVYNKHYNNEPVSTEYKQLMLANMIDTLGQQFVWLPLQSGGTVDARGFELALRARVNSRMQLLTTATYSRTMVKALDGVKRSGNFDIPLVVNAMLSVKLPGKVELDARETMTSGRPYTPFDLAASDAQSRGIYDLNEVNGERGPIYNRLDLELDRRVKLGRGEMDMQVGAENVMNRGNFMGYTWLNNCQVGTYCAYGQQPMEKINQMGRFPVASVRYRF